MAEDKRSDHESFVSQTFMDADLREARQSHGLQKLIPVFSNSEGYRSDNFVSTNVIADVEPQAAKGRRDHKMIAIDDRRVMLVEDQLIIALDVEDMLYSLGAKIVDLASSVEEGLRLLAAGAPDIGVLDVNMGSGDSLPIADELTKLGVPFVFATGYGDTAVMPEKFKNVPIVRKPYSLDALRVAIEQSLSSRK